MRNTIAALAVLRKYLRVSRKKKQLEKLANIAADNSWTLDEAVWLLLAHGYTLTGGKGSHQVFTAPDKDAPIVLAAHGKKLKSGYIRMIRQEILNQ